MLYRLIAENKPVLEGEFTNEEIKRHNSNGYSVYYFPNPPGLKHGSPVSGGDITMFSRCFVDCDLKDGVYVSKEAFYEKISEVGIVPSSIVDSGHGVHVYWQVHGLTAMSYLRFQRRLCRLFNTDEAVSKILQLMRYPGTMNTKKKPYVECVELYSKDVQYTAEDFDKLLPPILMKDEEYCASHYNRTYGLGETIEVSEKLPAKFGQLLRKYPKVKDLFSGMSDDRSKDDFHLANLLLANDFTKDEAMSVLVNCAKALSRAPVHRVNYAKNIVDKIWVEGFAYTESPTVRQILSGSEESIKGTRFPCNRIIDDTVHGFRLGQVIGIVGGSGVGKTTLTLNTFLWFAEANADKDYHNFFFSLEQPSGEVAARIRNICQGNDKLFDKIHIISNYAPDGTFRHFSMDSIEEHLLAFVKNTGHKVGVVVVDHIGVLSKSDKNGEMDGLIGVCKHMKRAAQRVNCMLIMLSQAPREKAGIGDIELDKSAAYGTVFFESFVDYFICLWQPLKRVYDQGAPTVMAFKFGKIRHKKQNEDNIKEDVCYQLYFDPQTELLREMTQEEEIAAKFWLGSATSARKLDKKTDLVPYKSRRVDAIKVNSNKHN